MPVQRGLTIAAAAAAGLAGRHVAGRNKAGKQTAAELDTRLADLGEVERLSILPVVERHTDMPGLHCEPGLSYLIKADDLTILFDTGLGTGRGARPDGAEVQLGHPRRGARRPPLRRDLTLARRPCRRGQVPVSAHLQLRTRAGGAAGAHHVRAHGDDPSAGGHLCVSGSLPRSTCRGGSRRSPAPTEALMGWFTAHHGFLISMHLKLIDEYGQALTDLDPHVAEATEPMAAARDLLISLPGISTTVAEVFLVATSVVSIIATALIRKRDVYLQEGSDLQLLGDLRRGHPGQLHEEAHPLGNHHLGGSPQAQRVPRPAVVTEQGEHDGAESGRQLLVVEGVATLATDLELRQQLSATGNSPLAVAFKPQLAQLGASEAGPAEQCPPDGAAGHR